METNKLQSILGTKSDRRQASGRAAAPGLDISGGPMPKRHTRLLAAVLMLGLVLALFGSSLSSAGAKPASAAGEPPEVVYNRFLAAMNRGGGVAANAAPYLADSLRWTFGYRTGEKRVAFVDQVPLAVWNALPGHWDYVRVEIISETVNGDTITTREWMTWPETTQMGIDRILSDTVTIVKDGKITSSVIYVDTSDPPTAVYAAALVKLLSPAPPATGTGVTSPRGNDLQLWTMAGAVLLLGGAAMLLRSRPASLNARGRAILRRCAEKRTRMFKKLALLVAILALVSGILGTSTAEADSGATTTQFALPFAWTNTCVTPPEMVFTALSGTVVSHMTDQVHQQRFSLMGTATAPDGTEYNVHLIEQNIFYHDPYPSWGAPTGSWSEPTHLKLQLISKGGDANYQVDVAVHFNELGVPTKMDLGGVECTG